MRRIVIVGAGIIGASIAWQLGRRAGVQVTILEKDEKQVGGLSYISDLLQSVPTTANLNEYARIVKEKAT